MGFKYQFEQWLFTKETSRYMPFSKAFSVLAFQWRLLECRLSNNGFFLVAAFQSRLFNHDFCLNAVQQRLFDEGFSVKALQWWLFNKSFPMVSKICFSQKAVPYSLFTNGFEKHLSKFWALDKGVRIGAFGKGFSKHLFLQAAFP